MAHHIRSGRRPSVAVAMAVFLSGCCQALPPNSIPPKSPPTTAALVPHPPSVGTLVAGIGATKLNAMIMAESAQIWQEYSLSTGGLLFSLGVDEGGVIHYVSTEDPRFTTPDGVHVGSLYTDVVAVSGRSAIVEPGFAYLVQLPSGWNAAFAQGPSMTEEPLASGARVRWVFQRIGYKASQEEKSFFDKKSGGFTGGPAH